MADEIKNTPVATPETSSSTDASSTAPVAVKGKKGKKRAPAEGKAYINATFNNTIISITNKNGDVLCWGTAGLGNIFKGTRKGTAYAAQVAAESAAKKALTMGMRQVEVYVKGPGPGRETAIRAIQATGMEVTVIRDVTPIPHNGCRPRKPRRM
ncbi:MAG TPA: 30S ribosomal protein S11 [Caldisericia bacterium]|jgi:small subunit ribosomal protein S11|nr:30S ribosomal protein S11 [Caldisericia bacterium]